MKKIIVIGSGFGGLSITSRLRSNGFDTTLIEKQPDLGGRARTFLHEGYKYDAGPTVITAPYLIDELFNIHSEKLSDYVDLLPVKPWYRFLFDNNEYLDKSDYMLTKTLTAVDFRSKNLETFDNLEKNSLDFYASVKSLYLQDRERKITNTKRNATIEIIYEGEWEEIETQ